MPKYKYMQIKDNNGFNVERDDKVWAYVPNEDGLRGLKLCKVVGINRKTAKVADIDGYEFTVPPRYFGLHLKADDTIINKGTHESLLTSEAELISLENHGVDNWPGYGDAMAEAEEGEAID